MKKDKVIRINPDSPLAQALKKMAEHKRLRFSFRRGEIVLEELNRLLKEKGIEKYYEHPAAV